jgi:hypothetical protein
LPPGARADEVIAQGQVFAVQPEAVSKKNLLTNRNRLRRFAFLGGTGTPAPQLESKYIEGTDHGTDEAGCRRERRDQSRCRGDAGCRWIWTFAGRERIRIDAARRGCPAIGQ